MPQMIPPGVSATLRWGGRELRIYVTQVRQDFGSTRLIHHNDFTGHADDQTGPQVVTVTGVIAAVEPTPAQYRRERRRLVLAAMLVD